jgi:hypothetical protein
MFGDSDSVQFGLILVTSLVALVCLLIGTWRYWHS